MAGRRIYAEDFSGGLVIDKTPHKLAQNQSPDLLNILPSGRRGIRMRPGARYLLKEGAGGFVRCVHPEPFHGHTVFAGERDGARGVFCADLSSQSPQARLLYGLPPVPDVTDFWGAFFAYEGALYFLGCGHYARVAWREADPGASPPVAAGLYAEAVEGYAPLAYVNMTHAGEGAANEPMNLLTRMYRARYIPDGHRNDFFLPHPVLPGNEGRIRAFYKGQEVPVWQVYQGGGRAAVLFYDPPAPDPNWDGGNALELLAPDDTDDGEDWRGRITLCRCAAVYGGTGGGLADGTRVFLAGNERYPGSVFWSAVTSGADYEAAAYFPDTNVEVAGDAAEAVTALAKWYGELIAFKARSVYGLRYTYAGGGAPVFTVRTLAGNVGCDMPGSVQLVQNDLLFANSYAGVHLLISNNNNDERAVVMISSNIGRRGRYEAGACRGLLECPADELRTAVSVDFDEKYWLCAGGRAFVWDYGLKPFYAGGGSAAGEALSWWYLEGLPAGAYFAHAGGLCHGAADCFALCAPSDDNLDFGRAIAAFYRSRGLDGGDVSMKKNVRRFTVSQNTRSSGAARFTFTGDAAEVPGGTARVLSLNLADFRFDAFTFSSGGYGGVFCLYPGLIGTSYFSWRADSLPGADLYITDVSVEYYPQGRAY